MKTLSFSRPLLLMIIGLPGAGKSFFANQFGDTFNAPVVSIDKLRFDLFENPTFSMQESDILKRVLDNQLNELLKTKSTIVIDGNCNSATDRRQIAAAAKKYGYDSLVIWVQTDGPTAEQRATKRSARRTGDKYNVSLNQDQFKNLSKRFTAPKNEQCVVISGKHSYNTQAKMVLRKLATPRADEAEAVHRQETRATERPKTDQPPSRPNERTSNRRNITIIH